MSVYDETVDRGDSKRCRMTFKNAALAVADPDVVKFAYIKPGAAQVTMEYTVDPDVIRESTGVYYVDLVFDTSGLWLLRWWSENTVIAAAQKRVVVRRTTFS